MDSLLNLAPGLVVAGVVWGLYRLATVLAHRPRGSWGKRHPDHTLPDDTLSLGPAPDEDDAIADAEYRKLRQWSEELEEEDKGYVAERIRQELRRRVILLPDDPSDPPNPPDTL